MTSESKNTQKAANAQNTPAAPAAQEVKTTTAPAKAEQKPANGEDPALKAELTKAQEFALKLGEELTKTREALEKATAKKPTTAHDAILKIERLRSLSDNREAILAKQKEASTLNFSTSGVQIQFTDDSGRIFKTGNPEVVKKCFDFILERLRNAQSSTEAEILELM